MPERTAPAAALRFVEDLKTLRVQEGVSLDDLHADTRVPVDVLENFERSALQDNRLFNRVYLRSLVRAYALAVGFDEDRATSALDEALAGNYDGSLLRKPESSGESDDAVEGSEAVRDEAQPVGASPAPPADAPAPQAPSKQAVEPPSAPPGAPPAAPSTPHAEHRAAPHHTDTPYHDQEAPAPRPKPAPTDWDAVSGSQRRERATGPEIPWGGILVAMVLLALVGGAVYWFFLRERAPAPAAVVTQADSTRQAPAAATPATPMPVTLPDTLTLVVKAKEDEGSDGIQDMKVQVDDDLRRPYWLEKGRTETFRFINRITVEQQLDDASLALEGRSFPVTDTDAQGRIVIDRDRARQHLQQQ